MLAQLISLLAPCSVAGLSVLLHKSASCFGGWWRPCLRIQAWPLQKLHLTGLRIRVEAARYLARAVASMPALRTLAPGHCEAAGCDDKGELAFDIAHAVATSGPLRHLSVRGSYLQRLHA